MVGEEGVVWKVNGVEGGREKNVGLWEVRYIKKRGEYRFSYVEFRRGKIVKNIRA